ncbi:MAG: hypothetical protein M0030_03410 [Actinomycetota bacterium]|nr:hypothetical protein [Actinomycetota bacterium]
MPLRRDPRSERYDAAAYRVLRAAAYAHRYNRGVRTWIYSPAGQYREDQLDKGGRTANERAFIRACYYKVWREPINAGVVPAWSLKLTWGKLERRGRRYGRNVEVRLYKRASGVRRMDQTEGWRDNPDGGGSWRKGTRRSTTDDRIDSNRPAGRRRAYEGRHAAPEYEGKHRRPYQGRHRA